VCPCVVHRLGRQKEKSLNTSGISPAMACASLAS
jgi:hypothetical protein